MKIVKTFTIKLRFNSNLLHMRKFFSIKIIEWFIYRISDCMKLIVVSKLKKFQGGKLSKTESTPSCLKCCGGDTACPDIDV